MNTRKTIAKTVVLAACLLAGGGACAECSRDDVNYFLEKGFSRDQVAAICGDAPAPARRAPPADDEYEGFEEGRERQSRGEAMRRERREDVSLLEAAVSAWDVEVTPKHLTYTRKLCLGAGGSPEVAARVKVCPEVRYRVYFRGLKVGGYQREYVLVGRREIEVEGTVKRKLLHDFKEYQPEIRRQLLGSYRARTREGGTVIPVRKDYPLQRVYQVLRDYAARASRAAS